MLRKYATYEQIELLRYKLFRDFTTSPLSPFDLAYYCGQDLSTQCNHAYPMQFNNYISLLRHYEAKYTLQRLTTSPDVLLIWDKYISYTDHTRMDYVLTKPDPETGYAMILHQNQECNLLWLDYSETETDHSTGATITQSIENLCRELFL